MYYFCEQDGSARKFECQDSLVFNFQIGSCDWPERISGNSNPMSRDLPVDTVAARDAAIGVTNQNGLSSKVYFYLGNGLFYRCLFDLCHSTHRNLVRNLIYDHLRSRKSSIVFLENTDSLRTWRRSVKATTIVGVYILGYLLSVSASLSLILFYFFSRRKKFLLHMPKQCSYTAVVAIIC